MYDRTPDARHEYIKRFLFYKCRTGKALKQVFGDLTNSMIWEEASSRIGGHSSSVFPAEIPHIKAAIQKHSPEIVLAFGKIAAGGCFMALQELTFGGSRLQIKLITGPHPCARGADTMELLESMKQSYLKS